jgi:hypothetical protein
MKSLRIGMVLSSLLALCWASGGVGCGSEPGTVDPSSLGGQSGYAGQVTSGRGGLAGTMTVGVSGSSGTTGHAGAITAGQAGFAGSGEAQPVWEPLGDILECHVERMANPNQVPGFTWKACDGVSDCEIAVFAERYGPFVRIAANSTVHDTGQEVRLGLDTWGKEKGYELTAFYDEDGHVLDGFRANHIGTDFCGLSAASSYQDRKVISLIQAKGSLNTFAVLAGTFSTEKIGLYPFNQSPLGAANGAPGPFVLGSERWMSGWIPGPKMITISAVDGSGTTVVDSGSLSDPKVYELGKPTTTGEYFLFAENYDNGTSPPPWRLMITDGLEHAKVYLQDPQPDVSLGTPRYAHSHLAWLRATGAQTSNKFDKVELWASPFDPDPTKLQPKKVADWPRSNVESTSSSGYGKMMGTYLLPTSTTPHTLGIWDLVTGEMQPCPMPATAQFYSHLGITRNHAYLLVETKIGYTVLRYKLK